MSSFPPFSYPPPRNSSNDQSAAADVECETVSLDESKKFKIININQATNLDGPGNKFEHKAQLIEIDKLLINNENGPKPNFTSKIGVWHQVSSLSLFIPPFRAATSSAKVCFYLCFFFVRT